MSVFCFISGATPVVHVCQYFGSSLVLDPLSLYFQYFGTSLVLHMLYMHFSIFIHLSQQVMVILKVFEYSNRSIRMMVQSHREKRNISFMFVIFLFRSV